MPGRDLAAQAWARITVPYIAQRPVMRRSPDGGRSFPRTSRKGYRYEVPIQPKLPNRPTTVPTFDHQVAKGRLLVLDLDTSRVPAQGASDRAGYVAETAARAVTLVEECGGRALVDVSPSGGRHVYVLWESLIPFSELRQLARAFALRFHPVVDTSPMQNTDAQIRGPGAPHKSQDGALTGFMTLTCEIEEAERICAAPCGPAAWEALQVELAAELDELAGGRVLEVGHPDTPEAPLDTCGTQYWPRRGGRGSLRADLEETARTGVVDANRYPSRSEARQAVLSSAAARGWRLDQVRTQLSPGGDWAAISGWWRDEDLMRTEWDKAVAFVSPSPKKVGDPVRDSNTRGSLPTPPAAPPAPLAFESVLASGPYVVQVGGVWNVEIRQLAPWKLSSYQQIRAWQQAMRIVERLLELEWAGRALSYRAILRAIGAAAQMSGSTTVEFGSRQLAYMTGMDHTTVSRALHVLREGPYALIDLVAQAEGTRADVYQLVIPDSVAADAAWRRWRPGRIEAIHPAFRELGLAAAFMYEALTSTETSSADLAVAALLPRSTAYDALRTLAAYGLAERSADGGWRRGEADLATVAAQTGAAELAAEQLAGHRADRVEWHAFLGIVQPAQRRAVEQAAAGTQGAEQRRPGDRRREAPRHLVAPPRRRLITEADVGRPEDADAELNAIWEQRAMAEGGQGPGHGQLPDDVCTAILDDLAAIAQDLRTPTDHAEYETELQALRDQLPDHILTAERRDERSLAVI